MKTCQDQLVEAGFVTAVESGSVVGSIFLAGTLGKLLTSLCCHFLYDKDNRSYLLRLLQKLNRVTCVKFSFPCAHLPVLPYILLLSRAGPFNQA